jgi:deoxyribodipyrimidine photolyase-related protein
MPKEQEPRPAHRVRLILGDQLNAAHSWYTERDTHTLYVLMEVRQETDYAWHHVQKVLGFFGAMRRFAEQLRANGHRVLYLTLDDKRNTQSIPDNLGWIMARTGATTWGYQLPDEYRLDQQLKDHAALYGAPVEVADTEHFLTTRDELGALFAGKKQYLMERFYRVMRERTGLLMNGDTPIGGQWNFDKENRGRPPKTHVAPPPLLFDHDLRDVQQMLEKHGVNTIGTVDAQHFPGRWTARKA